jgi:hypothetical protein
MLKPLSVLDNHLAPAEDIFFRWLTRVVLAAVLMGSAWIDDAPPLELAAWLVVGYVVARVVMQFGPLVAAVPFENRVLKILAAGVLLGLLGLSFLTVVTFVYQLALVATG